MKAPRLTLRTAIILPLTIILLLMSGVIYLFQSISYEKTLNEISRKELTTMSQSIKANLADYLYPTFIISSVLSQSIKHQFLEETSTSDSRIQFIFNTYNQLKDQIPQLDTLNIGLNKSGYYYGFRREKDQSLSLLLKDETTQGDLVVFSGTTTQSPPIYRVEDYDMRPRPWFAPIVNARKQMWSEPYINNDEKQEITLSALTPILNDNELYGVIAADIHISTFNKFLNEQKNKHDRSIFIFDSEQRLIAQSESVNQAFADNAPKTEINSPLSISGGRRSILRSQDPLIKATAQAYVKQGQLDDTVFSYKLNKKKHFAYVTTFTDDYGLNWHVAISIPELEVLSKLSNQQEIMNTIIVICTLILCVSGFIFLTQVTSPITQTAKAAQKLAKREWATPLPKSGKTFETYSLVKSFNDMANDLQTAFTDLHKQLAYDSLTQLYSREGLIEAVKNIKRLDGFVFVIGFDNFRDVNDSLGYLKGDQLLAAIAQRIKQISPDTNYHARIGGSEFAIVIPYMEEDSKSSLVNMISKAFASTIQLDMENILLVPSIGVSQAVGTPQVEQWLRQASIALSHAKKLQLKDSTYSVELEEASLQRTQTIVQITEALKHQEFEPFYQPLIDLKTNKIVGAEALARWQSPIRGLIPPYQFIPVAEESGLILQIGHQILMKACQDTQNEINAGRWPKDFHLHVNIAVAQLASEPFIYDLKHILDKTKITPRNLTLEVVESNLIDNETVLKNINAIRELGVGIAIDDFGTGYSSLSYLQTIPFDCLKIDRSFIRSLTQENCENSIAAAILSLMKDMKNVTVVAEGIETEEQAQILAQLGCEQVQGFYYGRPTPIQEWATTFPLES